MARHLKEKISVTEKNRKSKNIYNSNIDTMKQRIKKYIDNPLPFALILVVTLFIVTFAYQLVTTKGTLNWELAVINSFFIGFTAFVLVLTGKIYINIFEILKKSTTAVNMKKNHWVISKSLKYCLSVWFIISILSFVYGGIYQEIIVRQELQPSLSNLIYLFISSILIGFQFFLYSLIIAFLIRRLS